jgi:hypothetical protein
MSIDLYAYRSFLIDSGPLVGRQQGLDCGRITSFSQWHHPIRNISGELLIIKL